MTTKKKAARDVSSIRTATTKKQTLYFRTIQHIVKAVIVNAALLGWLPYAADDRLVQRGGLSHV